VTFRILEVDATYPDDAHTIRHFNAMVPEFPALSDHHLQRGHWWLIQAEFAPVGFAGMVEFLPGGVVAYLKRCYILPEARGHKLQLQTLALREVKARRLGYKQLVSETTNIQSAGNFIKAGFEPFEPEQRWGPEGSMYFTKTL
jgi:GNAT superfamily N-acetyltransferase